MRRSGLRPRVIDMTILTLVAAASLYFAHRGVQGGLGLRVGFTAAEETRRLEAELDRLRQERLELEINVGRLGGETIDLDLLDERARAILGRARSDEIVVR